MSADTSADASADVLLAKQIIFKGRRSEGNSKVLKYPYHVDLPFII